jgi:hypothetical protein
VGVRSAQPKLRQSHHAGDIARPTTLRLGPDPTTGAGHAVAELPEQLPRHVYPETPVNPADEVRDRSFGFCTVLGAFEDQFSGVVLTGSIGSSVTLGICVVSVPKLRVLVEDL